MIDEILEAIKMWLKDQPLSGYIIYIILLLLFFGTLLSKCACGTESKKPRPKAITSQTEKTPPKKITYNFEITGNGIFTFQGTNYKIEGLRDFNVDVDQNTDINMKWESENDQPITIKMIGNGKSEDWSSTKGEVSFNSGPAQCFITIIRPGWF